MKCALGLFAPHHNWIVNHPKRDAVIWASVESDLSLLIISIRVSGSASNLSTPHYSGCFSHIGSWRSSRTLRTEGIYKWSWKVEGGLLHYMTLEIYKHICEISLAFLSEEYLIAVRRRVGFLNLFIPLLQSQCCFLYSEEVISFQTCGRKQICRENPTSPLSL